MDEILVTKSVFKNINEVIPFIGPFGRFQKLVTFIFCIMIIPSGYQTLLMFFGALNPSWRCAANSTVCLSNETFPANNNGKCVMNRKDWEFTVSRSFSMRTEFDIYCDEDWIIHLTTSVFFFAWGLGAVVLGWIADNYGRKIVIFPSVVILILVGFLSAFSPNIIIFITCRFLIGFFTPGTGVQMFILISELVSTKYRPVVVTLVNTSVSVGLCLLSVQAFYLQNWKLLFIVCSVPYIFVVLFYNIVPESIRWLHLHGKIDQLLNVFHKISHWNKKTIPSDFTILPYQIRAKEKASPLDLFNTRTMAIQSCIQAYCWLVNAMVYYGLSLAADDLGGSVYTNFLLLSAVEIPAGLVAIYLCERIGRKKTTIGTMMFGSITCIVIAFIPSSGSLKVTRVALGILGKCCITVSFNAIYTWSIEIYPTDIRAQGIGLLQISSRIGAASSPWIAKGLSALHYVSPFLLMGFMTFVSAVSLLYLPETKGVPTPDTNMDGGKPRVSTMENCQLLNE